MGRLIFPVDQSPEFLVEGGGLDELLKGEVHTVVPVLVGIGRVVDLFVLGMATAQFGGDGQQVLEGEEAEHGWAGEMARHYIT